VVPTEPRQSGTQATKNSNVRTKRLFSPPALISERTERVNITVNFFRSAFLLKATNSRHVQTAHMYKQSTCTNSPHVQTAHMYKQRTGPRNDSTAPLYFATAQLTVPQTVCQDYKYSFCVSLSSYIGTQSRRMSFMCTCTHVSVIDVRPD
jgi:hypothetical protein